jgi:DNA polymerase-3 subunit chi
MTVINFYHLTVSPLGKALPKLMEKVYAAGHRALILTEDAAQTDLLNKQLWTYTTKFFLPHGAKSDGFESNQPIYLSHEEENPNQSKILAFVGSAEPGNLSEYDKSLYLFDGMDDASVSRARERWKHYKREGHEVTYWQQSEKGAWQNATA